MSVSSVASNASVSFRGGQVDLEQALDETVRELQKHLNMVQVHLRMIAATVDRDPDFSEELKLTGDVDDDLREMSFLFEDLRRFATDLISVPETAEDKALLKKWKIDRKILEKRIQEEHAAKVREERAASKAAMKAIKESEEDAEMKG